MQVSLTFPVVYLFLLLLQGDHLSPKESKEKRHLQRQIALGSTGSGSSIETSHSVDSQSSPKRHLANVHPPGNSSARILSFNFGRVHF